jgi:hypothetical protein
MSKYIPKKQLRLEPLSTFPQIKDLKKALQEADKAKGCTVELPWFVEEGNQQFSLTVRCEMSGGEPMWVLYSGSGAESRPLWSSPFLDMELLGDVLALSIPNVVGKKTELPAELAPKAEKDSDATSDTKPTPAAEPVQPTQPGGQPAPQAAPPGAPGYYPYAVPPGYMPYPPGYPPGYPQGYPPGYGYYAPGYYPMPGMPQGDPNAPQQAGQAPYPYPYPPAYPGYPAVPQPAQAPPEQVQKAGTVPMQPGPPASASSNLPPPPALPDLNQPLDLLKKKPNILLGHFLVEAGIVAEPTLDAALRVQELVKAGFFTTSQAAEAVRRAHQRGGLDPAYESVDANLTAEMKRMAPPLGQILVEAGLLTSAVLKEALRLQDIVRTGSMNEEEACRSLGIVHFGAAKERDAEEEDSPRVNRVIRLMVNCGIISNKDLVAARNTRHKQGGRVSKLLIVSGAVDKRTFEAAEECEPFVTNEKLKIEQAAKVLDLCKRSIMSFRDATKELKIPLT